MHSKYSGPPALGKSAALTVTTSVQFIFGTHIHRCFGAKPNTTTIVICRNAICLARLDFHFYFVSTYSRNTHLRPPLYEPGTSGSVRMPTQKQEVSP